MLACSSEHRRAQKLTKKIENSMSDMRVGWKIRLYETEAT